jgi:NADH-quinone oxidoreductase subunit E
MALEANLVAEFDQLAKNYPEKRAIMMLALHRLQDVRGWLSPEALEDLAAYLGMEPVEVFGVASFYPMYRLRPCGQHVVSICHNISCDLRGAQDIVAAVCETTGAPLHGTSPDGKFTVTTVECAGACANAPMFDLDGVYHEDLTPEKAKQIVRSVK